MSITFNDLLTEPKYREMSEDELKDLIISDELSEDNFQKGLKHFNIKNGNLSPVLFEYLQKLNAESEKKAEPNDLVEKLEYTIKVRKLIPKSIEVITERKPFSTTVTATLSIKLELTQELTPKQIEYILTSHFKRL